MDGDRSVDGARRPESYSSQALRAPATAGAGYEMNFGDLEKDVNRREGAGPRSAVPEGALLATSVKWNTVNGISGSSLEVGRRPEASLGVQLRSCFNLPLHSGVLGKHHDLLLDSA